MNYITRNIKKKSTLMAYVQKGLDGKMTGWDFSYWGTASHPSELLIITKDVFLTIYIRNPALEAEMRELFYERDCQPASLIFWLRYNKLTNLGF